MLLERLGSKPRRGRWQDTLRWNRLGVASALLVPSRGMQCNLYLLAYTRTIRMQFTWMVIFCAAATRSAEEGSDAMDAEEAEKSPEPV